MEILAILILLTALSLGAFVFGLSITVVYHLVAGLVIGAMARFVLPGRENIGLVGTALVGVAGGALGGFIGKTLHVGGLLELFLSVAVAAGLLSALGFRQKAA